MPRSPLAGFLAGLAWRQAFCPSHGAGPSPGEWLGAKPPAFFMMKAADGKPLSSEEAKDLWFCAHAGAKLCEVICGNRAVDAQIWATNLPARSPHPPAEADQPADQGRDTRSLGQGAAISTSAPSGVVVKTKRQVQADGAWRTANCNSALMPCIRHSQHRGLVVACKRRSPKLGLLWMQPDQRKRHRNDPGNELGMGRVGSQGCPTLWTTNSRF